MNAQTNAHEIEVTSVTTLEKLAAEGKFVSSTHCIPVDWLTADWEFTCDGVEYKSLGLIEVYAPGDDTGWAVAYILDDKRNHTGETVLLRGNWTIERVKACPVMASFENGDHTNAQELELTSITTLASLASLAAEGKFISAIHFVPGDWFSADWKFYLDGVDQTKFGVVEVYAPGDDTGWAVVFTPAPDGKFTGETKLVRGNWTFVREGHPRVHWAKDKPLTDSEKAQEYIDRADQLSEAPIG